MWPFRPAADRPAKPLRWTTPRWSEATRLDREFARLRDPRFWVRIVLLYAALAVAGIGAAKLAWPNLVLPPVFWFQAVSLPGVLFVGLAAQHGLLRCFPGQAGVGPGWVIFGHGQTCCRVKAEHLDGLRLTVFAPHRVRLRIDWRTPQGRRRVRHVGVPPGVDLRELKRLAPTAVAVRDARGRVGLTGARVASRADRLVAGTFLAGRAATVNG